ncbi:hypothetical protein Vafri_2728, partial [Volvox africanus]
GGTTDAAADAAERGAARLVLPRRATGRYGSSGGACGGGSSPALSSAPRRITARTHTLQQLKQVGASSTPIDRDGGFEGTGVALAPAAGGGGQLGDGSGDCLRDAVVPMCAIPAAGPTSTVTSSLDGRSGITSTNDAAGLQVVDGCDAPAFARNTSTARVISDSTTR